MSWSLPTHSRWVQDTQDVTALVDMVAISTRVVSLIQSHSVQFRSHSEQDAIASTKSVGELHKVLTSALGDEERGGYDSGHIAAAIRTAAALAYEKQQRGADHHVHHQGFRLLIACCEEMYDVLTDVLGILRREALAASFEDRASDYEAHAAFAIASTRFVDAAGLFNACFVGTPVVHKNRDALSETLGHALNSDVSIICSTQTCEVALAIVDSGARPSADNEGGEDLYGFEGDVAERRAPRAHLREGLWICCPAPTNDARPS